MWTRSFLCWPLPCQRDWELCPFHCKCSSLQWSHTHGKWSFLSLSSCVGKDKGSKLQVYPRTDLVLILFVSIREVFRQDEQTEGWFRGQHTKPGSAGAHHLPFCCTCTYSNVTFSHFSPCSNFFPCLFWELENLDFFNVLLSPVPWENIYSLDRIWITEMD